MDCTTAVLLLMIGATLLTALAAYFFYNKKIKDLKETLQDTEDTLSLKQKKFDSLLQENTQLSHQNQSVKSELTTTQAKMEALTQELEASQNTLLQVEERENQQSAELKNSNNELYVLKYRVQALTEELQNMKNTTEKLERDKVLVMEAYKSLQKQYMSNNNHKTH
jgi:chromosome segregation ATPase